MRSDPQRGSGNFRSVIGLCPHGGIHAFLFGRFVDDLTRLSRENSHAV